MPYLVRSKINPKLVYCTNGEFLHEDFVGPGHAHEAKIYKRESSAKKVLNGNVTVETYEAK